MASETGFRWAIALATQILGRTELSAGRPVEASPLLEQALRGFVEMDALWDVASVTTDLALLARMNERMADAEAGLADARARFVTLGVQDVERRIECIARTLVA